MKHLFYLLLVTFSFALVSCGGDDEVEECNAASINFAQEFSQELQDIVDAGTAFGTDPSASNCENYKEAVRDYINALRSFEDCAREAGMLAEFNAALNEYDESEIDNLC